MTDNFDPARADEIAEEQKAKARVERQQQVEDLKWLMAHAAGRRIVVRIFEQAGNRRTSFHTNGSTMAFNEGRRTVGLWLEGELLDVTPDAYLKMLKEFRSE